MHIYKRNKKRYEEERRTLLEELGLDQIEFEFDDFRSYEPITYDKYLEIDVDLDLDFDDKAMDQVKKHLKNF